METIKIKKNIVTNGMEQMRSEFVNLLNEKQKEFDKTVIKQSKADLGKGIILATMKGEAVASIYWLRSLTEDGKKQYSLLTAKDAEKHDFSEYATDNTPAEPVKEEKPKAEKKAKKGGRKKKQEEVIPEDPITHPTPEVEETPQEQEEATEAPATDESQEQELFNN